MICKTHPYPINNGKGFRIDFPPKHKKDLPCHQLPYSLKYAVKQYLMACAAKFLRQTSNVHNSMLIHVTRYTAVQNTVSDLIRKELQILKNRIGDSDDELDDYKKYGMMILFQLPRK